MGRANVPHVISDASALGGQSIGGSLRFRSASNTELSRTPSSAGNRKTFTWSGWVKRGDLSSTQGRLFGGGNTSNYFSIYFPSDDPLRVIWYEGGQVFTNPSPPPVSPVNNMEKFPFASDANAADVGDLTGRRSSGAGQQV